jgi:hypothetical protein
LTALLDSLDMLKRYQMPGKQPYVEEITEEQRMLYDHFGLAPPK